MQRSPGAPDTVMKYPIDVPTLYTARLTLRAFQPEDLEPLHAILSEEETIRHLPNSKPWPKEMVQRWIDTHHKHWRERQFGWWAVAGRETGELLGWCGLGYLDETDETEVLYLLKKSHWGKGLATEAAQRSVAYGFQVLGLQELVGLVYTENLASQRVLEKCGLVFSNEAHYFGVDLWRYRMDSARFEAVYPTFQVEGSLTGNDKV
jgi:RimJ/RimL family protein N-acetyltransferase